MKKFLNFDKLQKDYLGGMLKNSNNMDWFATEDGDTTYINTPYFIAAIPTRDCFIKSGIEGHSMRNEAIKNMMQGAHDRQIEDTGLEKKAHNKTVKIFRFIDGDCEEIWIDAAFYKYFEKVGDNLTLTGTTDKAPLFIEWGDYLAGLILPINKDRF